MELQHTPFPEPMKSPRQLPFGLHDLEEIRSLVRQEASEAGIGDKGSMDLVLAANEVATNSLKFGGGSGVLRIWRQEDSLICEIRDGGYVDVELLRSDPPAPNQASGRGIWLVSEICDRVQISSSRQNGTTVRLHMQIEQLAKN